MLFICCPPMAKLQLRQISQPETDKTRAFVTIPKEPSRRVHMDPSEDVGPVRVLKNSKGGRHYANLFSLGRSNSRVAGYCNPGSDDHRDRFLEFHSGWRDQHQWHRCHRCDTTRRPLSHPSSRSYGNADSTVPEFLDIRYVSAS